MQAQWASNQIFLLNVVFARTKMSTNYLLIKMKSIIEDGSLPETVELFRRVATLEAFDQWATLFFSIKDWA